MPVVHGEKLYGPPGPQNNAVLMDIISKLKKDLQQSRAENSKLVDQLNVLISLVKRAWSGEQGATMHLANIVGVPPPNFTGSEPLRNTPVPDKTRAVKNWERMAIRLLEKDYAAIQAEIKERQKLYMERRQIYMDYVIQDHQDEMAKFNLQRQKSSSSVHDVDSKFLRCYSAKAGGSRKKASAYRPKSAYSSQPRTASDLADRAEMSVGELIGQNTTQGQQQTQQNTNAAFTGLYRMSSVENDKRPPRRRQQSFDDPNRYKQSNLFDPDVIFSPEMMSESGSVRSRPSSASTKHSQSTTSLKVRPKSAVFITEARQERPLKYETTRPVSGKSKPSTTSAAHVRRNSAPSHQANAPAAISKKELHSKDEPVQSDMDRNENNSEDQSGHVTADNQEEEVLSSEKPPMSVKVRKGHPMDQFMNELRMADEMEQNFKKSAIELQRRLGIETDGFVY